MSYIPACGKRHWDNYLTAAVMLTICIRLYTSEVRRPEGFIPCGVLSFLHMSIVLELTVIFKKSIVIFLTEGHGFLWALNIPQLIKTDCHEIDHSAQSAVKHQ